MAYSQKRRFIAGAICPRCSAMDTLVVFNDDGKDYRACVRCDFKEQMHFKPAARELETRVNTPADQKQEQLQVVRILPPE